jgi:hydrogenase large subunit
VCAPATSTARRITCWSTGLANSSAAVGPLLREAPSRQAISAKVIADSLEKWLLELKPGEPTYVEYEIPDESTGMGLIEGSRGALGHWVEIRDKKIYNYQAVVPTTWNASPRDDAGTPGPMEQALIGTKIRDKDNPFELVRIVRSFDPCLACAIH